MNFPGKVDSQFLRSLQPVQYQAFASKIDGQLSSRGVKKLIQINFFTPLTFFEFDQSSDATLLPSSEKKKLASRRDFLVFCLRKIMLNFSGKVDSQFFLLTTASAVPSVRFKN
ncbi:hypothetical protein A4V04_06535 [Burkholderiales bacterium YL45]|uniref:Uncharacterized protein n=4 Tax=Turicimonas muris TaxID=1796652 RepID=A0A227KNT5_9BURK|nr:hypothetical protein A4V04_06535 [Burkholderiales bacterium YL45]OXE49759.1 hypothetical protein ADH67_06425 [Turicimonas muris]